MAKRAKRPSTTPPTPTPPTPTPPTPTPPTPAPPTDPRQRLLTDLQVLRVPVTAEALDQVLAQAAQQGWSHLEFANRLLGAAAERHRERSLDRRRAEASPSEAPLP